MPAQDLTPTLGRLHLLQRLTGFFTLQLRSVNHSRTLAAQGGHTDAVGYLDAQAAVLSGLIRVSTDAQSRMIPPAEWAAAIEAPTTRRVTDGETRR